MLNTPNLSTKWLPCPKPNAKLKSPPKGLNPIGKKTASNLDAVAILKKQFAAWNITSCELRLDGCLKDNFLAFAHVERRRKLTPEDVKSPQKVVLACQNCHHIVDYIMDRTEARELLEKIIKERSKKI